MHLPAPTEGGSFTPPPAGTHPAICYRVIDFGTQTKNFQGEVKRQHKIMLSWEISDPEMLMDDGRPFTVNQRYTLSMHEKATLRKHLEAWRGRAFTDADFGPDGFDIKKLIRVGCYLSIVHAEKDGKTYANIAGIMKLPKGAPDNAPLINEPVYIALQADRFDRDQFLKLSDSLQEIIKKSPEYAELSRPAQSHDDGYMDDGAPFNDDIPF